MSTLRAMAFAPVVLSVAALFLVPIVGYVALRLGRYDVALMAGAVGVCIEGVVTNLFLIPANVLIRAVSGFSPVVGASLMLLVFAVYGLSLVLMPRQRVISLIAPVLDPGLRVRNSKRWTRLVVGGVRVWGVYYVSWGAAYSVLALLASLT